MDLGLRDRVYLVTGGSRGLGFAVAQALVADGARVLLSAPHEATARRPEHVLRRTPQLTLSPGLSRITPIQPPGPARRGGQGRFRPPGRRADQRGRIAARHRRATTDEAWRSAFESVFLGAIRLARVLAADLGGTGDGGAVGGSPRSGRLDRIWCWPPRSRAARRTAISNGLFPGLAGVVKTLAGELGPPGSGSTGCCPSGSLPTGSVNLTPCAAIPMRCGPGCPSTSAAPVRGARGVRPGRRVSCPPPRPTSRAR